MMNSCKNESRMSDVPKAIGPMRLYERQSKEGREGKKGKARQAAAY
jgi:hypothetical protein